MRNRLQDRTTQLKAATLAGELTEQELGDVSAGTPTSGKPVPTKPQLIPIAIIAILIG